MKIAFMGAGKMGMWMANELSMNHDVAVYDIDRMKLVDCGPKLTVIHEMDSIESFGPDILINAVSLKNTVSAFETIEKYLEGDCILCDIATIKGGIEDYYRKSAFSFVSMHPMFGPTFAKMDALKEESAIIIKESDKVGADFFKAFFKDHNVKIFEYSFNEHDRMMAYSLTLPFISSITFASCISGNVVPGTTFSKHMRIAKGLLSEDDQLLTEILFNPHSHAELDRITAKLEYLKHIIRGKDNEEMETFLMRLRKNIFEGDGVHG